jgi:hypothetical protein
MSDVLDGVKAIGGAKATYCLVKCGLEAIDRERKNRTGDRQVEAQRFAMCLARCISPESLPESDTGQAQDNSAGSSQGQPADED